jgi:hypothetical protein
MKKGIVRLFGLMMFATLMLALIPTATFAASQSSSAHHKKHAPHFFYKPGAKRRSVQAAASNNLNYGGGAVMGGTMNVYAIFWEPTGGVSANYNSLITRYFNDIGGSSLYHIASQYTDSSGNYPSGSQLAGSWTDTSAYPESPLLDSDIQNEVTNAQNANGWSSGPDNIFFVFTERGQDLCFDSSQSQCASNAFCAYHNSFGNNTIYAAQPYAASFSCNPGGSLPNNDDADLTINVTSHEQIEAATDPNPSSGWVDSSGQEIGDKCAWTFGPRGSDGSDVNFNGDPYLLQQEWSNAISGCAISG